MRNSQMRLLLWGARNVLLILLILFIVYTFVSAGRTYSADAERVTSQVLEVYESDRWTEGSALDFRGMFGLDASDYDQVVYYKPATNMYADELLIVRSAEGQDDIMKAIQDRISSQEDVFDGYAPEEVALLRSAVVVQKGNYILYAVSDHADEYNAEFAKAIKQ